MVALLDVSGLPRHRLQAVGMLVAGVAVSATQDATIKLISTDYPFHEMQFIRSVAALPLIFLLTLRRHELGAAVHAAGSGLLHLRSLMLALASTLFYVGLAAIPLADATAIYFSMPMMLSLLSRPIIGETVPLKRWLALMLAFVGVLIVIRPGSSVFDPASLIMIAATVCYALGHMLTRPLGARVSTVVMGLYQNMAFLAVAALLGLIFGSGAWHSDAHPSLSYLTAGWTLPSPFHVLLLCFIGVSAAAAILLFTRAYALAEPSFVAPFEYTGLIWAVLLGFVMFGVLPGPSTLVGATFIIAAGFFMLRSASAPA
jgi:drug/metabolite transporter (DMT)-like permease